MKSTDKRPPKLRFPIFEGLSESEVNTLFNMADIKTLQPGEVLIREGDVVETLFVLLDGEMRIVKSINGRDKQIAVLGEGSWIGEIAFTKKIARTASAVAIDRCRVMAITRDTFRFLEERTQLFFYERLNELASERIAHLADAEAELSEKNRMLMQSMYRERTRDRADYGNSEMIRRIIAKVPKLPVFAGSLATKLLGANATPDEIAELIQNDPSTVATILKTVNSAYYAFQSKVADIKHAVVLLGFNEIYHLVVSEGVRQTMPDTPSFKEIHAQSVAVSYIAFILSQDSQVGKPTQMATIGLLHNMGKSVIQLLKEKNPDLSMLISSLDPAQIGAMLLKEWKMPEILWRSVALQFFPEFCPPDQLPEDVRQNVTVLYLAHLCYDVFTGTDHDMLPTAFFNDYKKLLRWEQFTLDDIVQKRILPVLRKKIDKYPVSFRTLLKNYTDSLQTTANPVPESSVSR